MRFALLFLAFVGLSVAPAMAQDWRAIEVSGAVRVIMPGEAPRTVEQQDVLPVGAVVTTGRDGRAVLSNGAARATLSANSRLTLAPSADGFTRFVQDLGAVLFQVDRQRDPHFEVRTSLVAAVVKGTTFTVSVEPDQHRVFVAEGTVEVSALDGGDIELVTGGGLAEVERDAPDQVQRPEPAAQHGAAPAGTFDYAALSGGLVRNREEDEEDESAEHSDHGGELVLAEAADPAGPSDNPPTDDDQGGGPAGDEGDAGDGDDGPTQDDDGNNGHGNDDDGDDDSNPGNGHGDDDDGDDASGDDGDGNNGHGNDDDGDDDSNPGNGGDDDGSGDDDDDSGPGNGDDDDDGNNGHGNDDDGDDDSNPGNGHGHGNDDDDDDDDDGNNGHGNDDDGDDDSNPGNGHGHGHDDDD